MEKLTIENFWKPLAEKYPDALAAFYKWIDEYKLKEKWVVLFNFGNPHYSKQGWHDPKYHELPIAMQFGIFLQFVSEGIEKDFAMDGISSAITEYFQNEQHFIETVKPLL